MGEDINILNTVIKGEVMAVESYNVFIKNIDDRLLRGDLRGLQQVHRNHIAMLAKCIQEMGQIPGESAGFTGYMSNRILNNKTANSKDKTILKEMEDTNEKGLNTLRDIIENGKKNISKSTLQIVEKVYEEDLRNVNKIKEISDRYNENLLLKK